MNENVYKLKGKEWLPLIGINPYYKRIVNHLSECNKNEESNKISNKFFLAALYQSTAIALTVAGIAGGLAVGLEHLLK
jgi:hypothetical protein